MKPKIVIFAGSRNPKDDKEIKLYAQKIGQEGFDLVYGGGTNGVMGIAAKEAQEHGAEVFAVLVEKYAHEKQLEGAKLQNTKTDLERFQVMLAQENVVGAILFPGGPGSIREAATLIEETVYGRGVPLLLPEDFPISENIWTTFQTSLSEGFIDISKKKAVEFINKKSDLKEILKQNPFVSDSLKDLLKSPKHLKI